jgi:VWFA-related protein
MMTQETRKTICLLLLLVAAPALIHAQSATPPAPSNSSAPQESAQPGAVLRVTTRLVLVDVVALDKKGLPITDLKAEDFSLQEEGTGQKVRVFNFQEPSQVETAGAAAQPVALPANMFSNVPTFKANKTLSVILLDGLNTDLVSQKYVRQELLKLLEKLPAGQPVAVYALGTKLRLLQDFTTEPSLLKQAINSSKGRNAAAMTTAASQDSPYLSGAANAALVEMGMQSMLNQIQLFQQDNVAAQTDVRVEWTLTALKSLARMLSGYPGRKNLIWVSSAFPAELLAPTPLAAATMAQGQSWYRNYEDEIQRTGNALSNARVAVYPVDARALVNHDVYSNFSNTDSNGAYLGRTASGRAGGSPGGMDAELNRTGDELMAAHTTMSTVAEMTGGKAFYGRNDLDKAIGEGLADGGTYYTLGYYPENRDWNGKFRKIVVTVNRPGAKLRYRQGYFAVDPKGYQKLAAKQQALDLGQSLSLDVPVATALTFRASMAPVSEVTGNKILIRYGIDAHPLGFELKDDGSEHASVDCAAQAFTLKGEPVQARASTFAVDLKPEQYQLVMQRFLPCNQSLELNPGDYVLRLGVRDNETGLIGTANARVTVPAVAGATGTQPEQKKP